MNFPGMTPSGGAAAPPGIGGPQDPNVKAVQSAMESCFGKSVMSGVMGFGMGGLFGMFMASMSYDTPYHTAAPVARKAQSHRFLSSNNSRSDSRIWEHDHGLWPRTSEKLALCTLA
ncbi:Mitochondrial import inner membrane translocase subunit tim22 [Fusarium oxysporum]|nr:Mitochondrial import inner membrane translocase subunit tim22 [Fusarium oxysporum]